MRPLLPLLCLLMNQCYLASDEPVGGIAARFDDTELAGVWKGPEPVGYMLAVKTKDRQVLFSVFDAQYNGDREMYIGFSTRAGKERFLNLRRVTTEDNAHDTEPYIIAHYSIKDGSLRIGLPATKYFQKAIALGNLTGTYSTAPHSSERTHVTGSGKKLAEFILAHLNEPGMIETPKEFKLVKLP